MAPEATRPAEPAAAEHSGHPLQVPGIPVPADSAPGSPVDRVWLAHWTHTPIPAGLQHRLREPYGRSTFRETRAAEVEPADHGDQGEAGANIRPWEAGATVLGCRPSGKASFLQLIQDIPFSGGHLNGSSHSNE